jgi:uncharacterized protein (TIGR03086 family)
LLNGITDDHLTAPTPCEAFTVGDLLDHLMGLTIAFSEAVTRSAAAAGSDAESGEVPVSSLHPEWRTRLPLQLDDLVVAWRAPVAWDGMTEVGGVSLSGAMTGGFALNELILHGWDLARATDQAFGCDPVLGQAALSFTTRIIEQGFHPYGVPVSVPDDARTIDRLLALAGRDPSWTP